MNELNYLHRHYSFWSSDAYQYKSVLSFRNMLQLIIWSLKLINTCRANLKVLSSSTELQSTSNNILSVLQRWILATWSLTPRLLEISSYLDNHWNSQKHLRPTFCIHVIIGRTSGQIKLDPELYWLRVTFIQQIHHTTRTAVVYPTVIYYLLVWI